MWRKTIFGWQWGLAASDFARKASWAGGEAFDATVIEDNEEGVLVDKGVLGRVAGLLGEEGGGGIVPDVVVAGGMAEGELRGGPEGLHFGPLSGGFRVVEAFDRVADGDGEGGMGEEDFAEDAGVDLGLGGAGAVTDEGEGEVVGGGGGEGRGEEGEEVATRNRQH